MVNCEYKQIGQYKVRELPNPEGKGIEETLQEIFLVYCENEMQKQLMG